MKITQVSEHIWSLKTWMLIPVQVWVVAGDDGLTLVDAGFPYMARGILNFVDRLNRGPLQRILLTHGHSDHVGQSRRFSASALFPFMPIGSNCPIWRALLRTLAASGWSTTLPRE